MFNLEILGSLASQLHREFRDLFYLFLPLFFCIALALAWFRTPGGGSDFVDAFKRVIVASLLLAAFQEITDAILLITTSLTQKISDMDGLDSYMRMISEKAATIPMSPMGALLAIDDFIMAALSYLSYFIVYLARFLMLSIYHFTWIFLIILSPFLLLFHVFTSKITLNLFKTLIEVASWPIVWSVLSVMIKSLPYGNAFAADSGYLTLIIMNFVIAIALVLTPFLVKGMVGGAFSAVAASFVPITATVFKALPAKAAPIARLVGSKTTAAGQGPKTRNFGSPSKGPQKGDGSSFTKPPPRSPSSRGTSSKPPSERIKNDPKS